MVCNFPDDEVSWLTNRIINIRSRFGLILVTYRSNLQNGKQYSAENLYLIGRRRLLPGTGSNHGNWSHFRFEPVQTSLVWTIANNGKSVNTYLVIHGLSWKHAIGLVICYHAMLLFKLQIIISCHHHWLFWCSNPSLTVHKLCILTTKPR